MTIVCPKFQFILASKEITVPNAVVSNNKVAPHTADTVLSSTAVTVGMGIDT